MGMAATASRRRSRRRYAPIACGWPAPHASAQHGARALSPQVEKVVVEETISPFAQSPLMVAMSTLQVRQGPTHDSALVETCHKILPGSLVRVGAKEMLSFKEKLMTKPVMTTDDL